MSLFAPQKMSLNESKNWDSKSRRLKDSCLANTLVLITPGTVLLKCKSPIQWNLRLQYVNH